MSIPFFVFGGELPTKRKPRKVPSALALAWQHNLQLFCTVCKAISETWPKIEEYVLNFLWYKLISFGITSKDEKSTQFFLQMPATWVNQLNESCCLFLVCNVTISSRNLAARSGLSWVEIRSPELQGPTSCWWRLASAPGQRIEVQIHRLLSVGSYDNVTQS